MITTKVVSKPNFGGMKINLAPELNDGATIVKLSIQQHIAEGQRIDGAGAMKPLAPSTIEAKRNYGSGKLNKIGNRMRKSQDLGRVVKLSEKFSKTKESADKVRSHATDPMQATENLRFNQKISKATASRQIAEIEIGKTRAEWVEWHNETRPFWGIAPEVDKKIDRMVELKIDRILRDS